MSTLFESIKELRIKKGFTQCDMAKVLDVTQAMYASQEKGKRNFNNKHLEKLSKFLNVDLFKVANDSKLEDLEIPIIKIPFYNNEGDGIYYDKRLFGHTYECNYKYCRIYQHDSLGYILIDISDKSCLGKNNEFMFEYKGNVQVAHPIYEFGTAKIYLNNIESEKCQIMGKVISYLAK